MVSKLLKLEGTWEEIAPRLAQQLAGQRVRAIIFGAGQQVRVIIIPNEPYGKISRWRRRQKERQNNNSRYSPRKTGQKEPESLLEATPSTLPEQKAIELLSKAGIVTPPPRDTDIPPVPEEAWNELTERLRSLEGKPLSEIIIEDRGSR